VIPATAPFTVAVRVTNTSKKPIDWFEIDLGGRSLNYNGFEGALSASTTDEDLYTVSPISDDYTDDGLKPGESRVATFTVTPDAEKPIKDFTLVAHAHGSGGGSLDVITFKPTEAPPPAVAEK
jgi:hypothetical protein